MARAQHLRQQLNGSHTSTTVLSVSIMNPYYRDLLALQQDFAQNQAQLKLTQQTLQQTYHDLMLAQEQKRKAESDAIQLRLQWDNVVKKHLDHLPERQLLVQQVAELKEELERERQFRTTLQNERGGYIQEILKLKADVHSLKATANTTSSSSPSIFAAPPTRRSSSSSNSGGGGVVGFFFSRQSTSSSLSHPPAARAPASPPSSSLVSSSPPPPPVRIIQPTKHALSSPHHPSPPAAPSSALSPTASLDSSHYSGSNNPWSSDGSRTSFSASSASHDESLEFLEAEKAYYEQLRQENAALVTTVQELKDKQGREQESIKSYMSLFESLQKKQANALALAQADLDLLRADQAASQARLEARSSLVHAFAATVNAQATEIERLTADRGRHQVARAQVEQELAALIDASLSTLQRLIGHLQTGYRQIVETALEPMRQTIHHLASLPPTNASADTDTDTDKDTDIDTDAATAIVALCRDWESCELAVEQCWHALELSLVQMQQAQELGLAQKSRGTSSSSISSTSSSFSLISPPPRSSLSSEQRFSSTLQRGAKPPSIITDMGGAVGSVAVSASAAAVATATAAMTDLEVPSTSSTLYSSSSSSSTSSSSQCQNGTSRQDAVIMERKTMADTYLEDCVVSVEQLARDKRILQQLVLDLRKEKAAKDEEALVRKLMSLEDGAQQASEQQEEHEREEQVAPQQQQQQQQVTSKAAEEQDNSVEDEKEGKEIEIEVDVDVDGRDNIEEDSDSSATPAAPCEDGAPTIESDHSNRCQGAVDLCQPEQQDRSAAQEESDHVREARERIARLENLLATVLAWIESIDSSDPVKFPWYYHRHRQQSHLDETVSELSEEGILALDVQEALPALSSQSLGGSPCKDTVLQSPVPNDGTQPSDPSMAITEARTSTPLQIMTMIRQELVATHHRPAVAAVTTDGACHQVTKFPVTAQNDESKGGPVHLGRQTSFTATTKEPNRQHHKESLVSSSSSPQMQQQRQRQHLQSEAWSGRIEGQETCATTRSRSGSHGLLPRFLSFARTTDKCCDVDIDSDLEEAEEAEAEEAEEAEDEDDDDDDDDQKVARIRQQHHHRKKVSPVAEVEQTPSLPFGTSASDREHQTTPPPPPPPLSSSSPPSSSPTSSPTPSLPLSPKRPPYLLERHHHDRRSIHTNIALLAPSFSPAPGIGSGGQQVDVEAFCRDLAFRSFPKLHQWSKAQRAQKRSVGFVGSGSK